MEEFNTMPEYIRSLDIDALLATVNELYNVYTRTRINNEDIIRLTAINDIICTYNIQSDVSVEYKYNDKYPVIQINIIKDDFIKTIVVEAKENSINARTNECSVYGMQTDAPQIMKEMLIIYTSILTDTSVAKRLLSSLWDAYYSLKRVNDVYIKYNDEYSLLNLE